jgi:hypothetical protein
MIWKCNSRIIDFIEILKSKSIDFTLPHRKSSWYSLSNIQPPSYNKIEDLTPYCCFIRWVNDTNSYYFFKIIHHPNSLNNKDIMYRILYEILEIKQSKIPRINY